MPWATAAFVAVTGMEASQPQRRGVPATRRRKRSSVAQTMPNTNVEQALGSAR